MRRTSAIYTPAVDVLVVGAGAREHAIAWRLARDDGVGRVRIAPGNGGTQAVGPSVDVDISDPDALARHAVEERYGLVVVGPEGPLAAGVVDGLESARIPVFGPARAAARLESSKAFAKEQMRRAGVPTPAGESFTDPDAACASARARWESGRRVVVKADWLAAGKGVVVPDGPDGAEAAIQALFGAVAPGARVIVEERLEGREVSAFALVSGETVVPLAAAQDYKRLGDGDTGPNTGGMGAYAPIPWFGRPELEETVERVFEPIAWRMARDGIPYRGVLYAGLMLTADGPVVLEFNARFGDPEAQVLMPLIDGDLAAAMLATARGDRSQMEAALGLRGEAAVGVVVASEGYPDAPITGRPIAGADPSSPIDDGRVLCFHAATRRGPGGGWEATGGRVATIVGRGATLAAAREAAYRAASQVDLPGAVRRDDIAQPSEPSSVDGREAGTTEPAQSR